MKKTIVLLAIILLSVSAGHAELVQLVDAQTLRTRLSARGFHDFDEKTNLVYQIASQRIELEVLCKIVDAAIDNYDKLSPFRRHHEANVTMASKRRQLLQVILRDSSTESGRRVSDLLQELRRFQQQIR